MIDGVPEVGVSVVAGSDGYSVDLCLIARVVPLVALATELRERIRRAAPSAPAAGEAGSIQVRIVGVEEDSAPSAVEPERSA